MENDRFSTPFSKPCIKWFIIHYVKQFFVENGRGSHNGNQVTNTIPMKLFPDKDENDVSNHDIATLPQTRNQDIDEATLDEKDDTTVDLLEYDVITADETDGGAGSKMVMGGGPYLGMFSRLLSSDMHDNPPPPLPLLVI